ncbi:Trimethyl guanosine synthase, putative [Candida dubliniensis CD36]|uniref:Trimethylguanosine synthase n=1 Tax=Candida dubliniensis (strain CD36 / ATCC MYA-646 / CBS 7987 / NCPF 3949 / NRRL Y-17841) TaxID=573826 RepID=B9WC22_CANDC|nr:Trimethyl guanosine synthase, putative [Candida dubliniensis CD36]CAX43944.1 Trimethyl guanosine synthase, putative [Candida dubliniensis CD36]
MYGTNNDLAADDNATDNKLLPQSIPINLEANKVTKKRKKKRKKKKKTRKQNTGNSELHRIEQETQITPHNEEKKSPAPLAYDYDPLSYNQYILPSETSQEGFKRYQGELLTHTVDTLPAPVKKFWKRRYALFEKFDEGIYLSSELWYSVTAESIAKYTAGLFRDLLPNATSGLDLCCGGGGNTIQFAKLFDHIGALDINPINLYCTEHNCNVYGVQDNVWMIEADWNEVSKLKDGNINIAWIPESIRRFENEEKVQFDFVFSSPPWGGTNYNRKVFDLNSMEPFPITRMLKQIKQYTNNVGLYLPRSSNLKQLKTAVLKTFGKEGKCRVVHLRSDGRIIAILALIGKELTENFDSMFNDKEDEGDASDGICSDEIQISENEMVERTTNASYDYRQDSNNDEDMTEDSDDTGHEVGSESKSENDPASDDNVNNKPKSRKKGKDSTKKVSEEELQKIIQEYVNSGSTFQFEEVLEDYESDDKV